MRFGRESWLLVSSLLASGCDYPLYIFVPDDAAVVTDSDDPGRDAIALDTGGDAERSDATLDALLDGTADGTTSDGARDTSVTDSGIDTVVTSDVLVSKGCSGSSHTFCADFDSVLTPETGWTDVNLVGGGTNGLDRSLFASPPASYVANLPASTLDEASATLNEDLSLASPGMVLHASALLRLDAATSAQETLLMKISRVGSGTGVEVVLGPSGLVMDIVGTSSSGSFPLVRPPTGVWFKLELEVVLSATNTGSAKAYVDGKILSLQSGVATATTSTSNVRLVVGLYQSDAPISAIKMELDDVTLDTL